MFFKIPKLRRIVEKQNDNIGSNLEMQEKWWAHLQAALKKLNGITVDNDKNDLNKKVY